MPGGVGTMLVGTSRWRPDPKRAHSFTDCVLKGSGRSCAGWPFGSRPVRPLPSRLRWGEVPALRSDPRKRGPTSPWDRQWILGFPSVLGKSMAFGDTWAKLRKYSGWTRSSTSRTNEHPSAEAGYKGPAGGPWGAAGCGAEALG